MEERMIGPKEAYGFAMKYFKELVGDYDTNLEEVEAYESFGGKCWYVTISYFEKEESDIGVKFTKKRFKKFVIDAYSGEFHAMRNG